jgi:hypothetical protein
LKIMTYRNLFFLLTAFAFSACDQGADQVAALEKEVLGIHDEVMPRMGEIMALKKGLSQKIAQLDSLQQEGASSTTLAQERQQALDLTTQLIRADSLMMGWMYEYKGDSAKALPAGEALEYFRLEKDKIVHVQEVTTNSIQEAREFLK